MYYCIVCSQIHGERNSQGNVFKKGLYVDPGTGAMIHLGMCEEEHRGTEDNIQLTIDNDYVKLKTINSWLPIHQSVIENSEFSEYH
ncbi:hypothetical protein A8L34_10205 [Bacillus sp. FJAT-27264]|uniref:DUF3973 domain-containing protein n=1 Tax=Paenibacillus sp. (strain DSM 101736 / FJAT-27264) TaxID=1850362 RepID=UPI000807B785|nr:DUF3973 domain-containing protein [Bacillus sp. FJAT-27264]OBZ14313.1 hypothetical protein A8L34_10205 [Bacillus sp. FJAT-27264]